MSNAIEYRHNIFTNGTLTVAANTVVAVKAAAMADDERIMLKSLDRIFVSSGLREEP